MVMRLRCYILRSNTRVFIKLLCTKTTRNIYVRAYIFYAHCNWTKPVCILQLLGMSTPPQQAIHAHQSLCKHAKFIYRKLALLSSTVVYPKALNLGFFFNFFSSSCFSFNRFRSSIVFWWRTILAFINSCCFRFSSNIFPFVWMVAFRICCKKRNVLGCVRQRWNMAHAWTFAWRNYIPLPSAQRSIRLAGTSLFHWSLVLTGYACLCKLLLHS